MTKQVNKGQLYIGKKYYTVQEFVLRRISLTSVKATRYNKLLQTATKFSIIRREDHFQSV